MAREMIPDEVRAFLLVGTRTAMVATVRADGRPHVAPVWFVLDGDDVIFNTGANTTKGKGLRHDPRVSLAVDDATPPFSFVVVEGIAELSDDLEEMLPWSTAIAGRYMGADQAEQFGRRNAVKGELLVRVHPQRTISRAGMTD
jgi:PPOX class probable F420-dependent enzyme